MRHSISLLAQKNIKKIDSVLEPVSNMCDEHRRNQIRRRKLDGEQAAFLEDRVRNMGSADRERLLNETGGKPLDSLKPRYLCRSEVQRLVFSDAGGKLLKPILGAPTVSNEMAKDNALPANPGSDILTRGSVKILRPDLSREEIVSRIQEANARNLEAQRRAQETRRR